MKLLLVDDEFAIREHVKMLLEGSEYEIYEADHGESALQVLESESIDLLLTDIRMPVMDGLELIQQCRMRFPELVSLVLSNYAEFSLAQSALKKGAKNYILKATMTRECLLREIGSTLTDSLNQQRSPDKNEMISIMNMLFLERMTNSISQKELIRRSDKHGITFFNREAGRSMFALLQAEHIQKWETNNQAFDLKVFALINVLDELIKNHNPGNAVFHLSKDLFLITDLGETGISAHMEKMADIQRLVKKHLQIGLSVVCGYEFHDFEQLLIKVKSSKEHLDQLFYRSREVVVPYSALRLDGDPQEMDLYFHFQELLRSDRFMISMQQIPSWVTLFFDLIRQTKRDPGWVKNDLMQLMRFIEQKGYAVEQQLKDEIEKMKAGHLDDYFEVFQSWLAEQQATYAQRTEITKAVDYIHACYQDKISVDDVANHVNMSRSHFSKIFKEHHNKTIVEYLEGYRMNQARLLLRTSPLTVRAVAEQVGIPDIYYFSKLYKRFYKTSPSLDRSIGG